MVNIIKTIIIGIIEGITEWLPISSTGHMIIANEFLKLDVSPEFWEFFEVVIQLGAIFAVVLLFFKELFPWGFGKEKQEVKETFNLWFKIAVSCIPLIIVGLLLDDYIDEHFYNSWTVAIALIVYGIAFIVVEKKNKGKKAKVSDLNKLSYKQAFILGTIQSLAVIPGTSRSGTSILGGLLLGLDRNVATSYTFYLAVPVMGGASLLKLLKYGFSFTSSELVILFVGMFSAFVVSFLTIKFLIKYIKKNDFTAFGYYRIVLGIVVILYFLLK